MNIEMGKTQIRVHSKKGEYLYTGTYMGMGTKNLGLNGQQEGVIVLAQVDDETAQCEVVPFDRAFFEIGD